MANYEADLDRRTVVVIGNGMVGHRFCENAGRASTSTSATGS